MPSVSPKAEDSFQKTAGRLEQKARNNSALTRLALLGKKIIPFFVYLLITTNIPRWNFKLRAEEKTC
jgi:hypothetical protein